MPVLLKESLIVLFGSIVGAFIMYRFYKRLIKDQTAADYISDAFDFFNTVMNKIISSNWIPSKNIINSLNDADSLISAVEMKIGGSKAIKLRQTYEKYKAPNPDAKTEESRLFPYDFNEEVFGKHPQYHVKGVKNGKELAIHNVKQVLELLK